MKRKVLAQRKFAQGVPLPTATGNLRNERRSQKNTAASNKNPTIRKFNMKPTSLLDIISFQNIHEHGQAVVLVEKLTKTIAINQLPTAIQNNGRVANNIHKENEPIVKKISNKKKLVKCAILSKRHLRSTKPDLKKSGRAPSKRKIVSTADTGSSSDDNTPLTHLCLDKKIAAKKLSCTADSAAGSPGGPATRSSSAKTASAAARPATRSAAKLATGSIVYNKNYIEHWVDKSLLKEGEERPERPSSSNDADLFKVPRSVANVCAATARGALLRPAAGASAALEVEVEMAAEAARRGEGDGEGEGKGEERHCAYLDLFPAECPYLVQIVKVHQLMRARVVPRSDSPAAPAPAAAPAAAPSPPAELQEAPVFTPTPEQFQDPLVYLESIMPEVSKYGIGIIKPPPGFSPPPCHAPEHMDFVSTTQYVCRMYKRWGATARTMAAIKVHLAAHNVKFKRPPLVHGMEVNLVKLYDLVQKNGGLKEVLQKKKWAKIADDMNYGKSNNMVKKLDSIYVKYVLPYETLTNDERQQILDKVERAWNKRYRKMLKRAQNPLHRQKRMLGETSSSSSSSSAEGEEERECSWLREAEDCVVPGRKMTLQQFNEVGRRCEEMLFPGAVNESGEREDVTPEQIERRYWELVTRGDDHVSVSAAAVDTQRHGYGFPDLPTVHTRGEQAWNLKMLCKNPGSMLSWASGVVGATVPTLHLGMAFTTGCWHRDPHALPWLDYLHSGKPKIWYGVGARSEAAFRAATLAAAPERCRSKRLWLPSEAGAVPLPLLLSHGTHVSRAVQSPGEYTVVARGAYASSLWCGRAVAESCYLPPRSVAAMVGAYRRLRACAEPAMLPLPRLLVCAPPAARACLRPALRRERRYRRLLRARGALSQPAPPPDPSGPHPECDLCRAALYFSKVCGVWGSQSELCTEHAVRLWSRPRRPTTMEPPRLLCYYSDSDLRRLLSTTETTATATATTATTTTTATDSP